jgi:hypothetical protein
MPGETVVDARRPCATERGRWHPSPSLEQELLCAAFGELKCERLSCGCAVEMGVYSVEEASAKANKRNALASPTGTRAGEEHEAQVRETTATLGRPPGRHDHSGVR